MRIRTIKPEFWRSTDISAIEGWGTRLLFIGLWSYVDDNGVGIDRLALIATDLFPDDVEKDPHETFARVSRGLDELSDLGRITRYYAEGKNYLAINNWLKHQKIDKPGKARYPDPTSENAVIRGDLARRSRDSGETPASVTGEQGNRGTGEAVPSDNMGGLGGGELAVVDAELVPVGDKKPARSSRASRMPEDWHPPDDVKRELIAKYPNLRLGVVLEEFRNYWMAEGGQRARKVDWVRTFRNRVAEIQHVPRFQRGYTTDTGRELKGADKKLNEWDVVEQEMETRDREA